MGINSEAFIRAYSDTFDKFIINLGRENAKFCKLENCIVVSALDALMRCTFSADLYNRVTKDSMSILRDANGDFVTPINLYNLLADDLVWTSLCDAYADSQVLDYFYEIKNTFEAGGDNWRKLFRDGMNLSDEFVKAVNATIAMSSAAGSLFLLIIITYNCRRVMYGIEKNEDRLCIDGNTATFRDVLYYLESTSIDFLSESFCGIEALKERMKEEEEINKSDFLFQVGYEYTIKRSQKATDRFANLKRATR